MPGAVVITRPRAQAQPLAARVEALGRKAELLPLLEIAPLPDPAPLLAALARLHQYALVAFVSPNAIDAAFAHIPQWPAGVTLAVLGEGSRAALAAHGIPTPPTATANTCCKPWTWPRCAASPCSSSAAKAGAS
jgi:uroporphyrinogen-III synthase